MARALSQAGGLMAAVAGLAIGLGGCVNIMERSVVAPDWFEAKAEEVRGQGYPALRDVPVGREPSGTLAQAEAAAETLQGEADQVETFAAAPIATPEEIRARAAQWRAETESDRVAPLPTP
jgi:hypothetical protein